MSHGRGRIQPPELDGYSYLEHLGSGGFADVFLYEQHLPRRKVAVKVLDRFSSESSGLARFVNEANLMASLSNHPYIVTIFSADISKSNHPYLVMEYYPGANYGARCKSERFSVAQVLRLGIQVAGAVETAHRAEVLHRDIKPANILTSAYGRPGLTDFGIAAAMAGSDEAAEGLSIPWSPPESLAEIPSSDPRSDVYSLAATLYTILAGHSPFEMPGGSNRSIDLIDRIERSVVPEFERTDVPGSLYRLLAQAMSKEIAARPASAAAFARSLQSIEAEQAFDLTPLEVSGEIEIVESRPIDVDAGETQFKAPTAISSQSRFAAPDHTTTRADLLAGSSEGASFAPIRGVPLTSETSAGEAVSTPRFGYGPTSVGGAASAQYRPPTFPFPSSAANRPSKGPLKWIIAAIAVVVLIVGGVIVVMSSGGGKSSAVPPPIITKWGPGSGSEWTVTWSTEGGEPNDTYWVTYDGQTYQTAKGATSYTISRVVDTSRPIVVQRERSGVKSNAVEKKP